MGKNEYVESIPEAWSDLRDAISTFIDKFQPEMKKSEKRNLYTDMTNIVGPRLWSVSEFNIEQKKELKRLGDKIYDSTFKDEESVIELLSMAVYLLGIHLLDEFGELNRVYLDVKNSGDFVKLKTMLDFIQNSSQ